MVDHPRRLAGAAEEYTRARKARDKAIRAASNAGVSYRKIGEIVGLSYSRVMQIVRGH